MKGAIPYREIGQALFERISYSAFLCIANITFRYRALPPTGKLRIYTETIPEWGQIEHLVETSLY
jgi:hypothetical protein